MTEIRRHPYVVLAREAVARYLRGEGMYTFGTDIDSDESLWKIKRACFVSIKMRRGRALRGCIGTLLPVRDTVDAEIVMNAVAASTRDQRFDPMVEDDLDDVIFSVDVLSSPEVIKDKSQLDHRKYGVIVSQGRGIRRGVLLPDLPGVGSVDQQLTIAAQKAGITSMNDVVIERFTVDRYSE